MGDKSKYDASGCMTCQKWNQEIVARVNVGASTFIKFRTQMKT